MKLQELISRLTDRGSFDLNSDTEFSALSRVDQISVRMAVRNNLLMES